MHDANSNTNYIAHANISSCIYLHNLITQTCYAISQSITPKISSLWLIIKHEQFNLNYSTKQIFTQIYFHVTIHVNNETLGSLFTSKYPISVSPCETELYSHFRPHTHHNTICFTIYTIYNPNSPCTVTDGTNGFQNFLTIRFQALGPINWPLTASINSNIINTLKQSVKLK